MRPFGQSGPAFGGGAAGSGIMGAAPPAGMGMGMGMGAAQGQVAAAAAPPPNANGTGFGGYLQCFTNNTGTYEEYSVKSIVCEGKNFGKPSQNFSSEMLRWDDYRQAKQINDGSGPLKAVFDTNAEGLMQGGLPFIGHREVTTKTSTTGQSEKLNHLYNVFVCHPRICGTAVQNYCSEMDRWDDMRVEKKINDGTPGMRQTFAPEGGALLTSMDTDVTRKAPATASSSSGAVINATGLNQTGQFTGYQTETTDSKGTRSYNAYKVISCKPMYEGRQAHNFSCDMQRWDDYRQAKQINDGLGPLAQMFDVTPTAAAVTNRMGGPAPGGFGAPAPAPGGFGAPAPAAGFGAPAPAAGGFGAPAPGGFGVPATAPGGFGAPAPAAGGFGGPAPAAGGFGAPAAGGFGRRY